MSKRYLLLYAERDGSISISSVDSLEHYPHAEKLVVPRDIGWHNRTLVDKKYSYFYIDLEEPSKEPESKKKYPCMRLVRAKDGDYAQVEGNGYYFLCANWLHDHLENFAEDDPARIDLYWEVVSTAKKEGYYINAVYPSGQNCYAEVIYLEDGGTVATRRTETVYWAFHLLFKELLEDNPDCMVRVWIEYDAFVEE